MNSFVFYFKNSAAATGTGGVVVSTYKYGIQFVFSWCCERNLSENDQQYHQRSGSPLTKFLNFYSKDNWVNLYPDYNLGEY